MKPPKYLIAQNNGSTPATPLPNGEIVTLIFPTVDARLGNAGSYDPLTGILTVNHAGLWELSAGVEAERVAGLELRIEDISRTDVYRDYRHAPLNSEGNADQNIVCTASRLLRLREGDTFKVNVRQYGSVTATLWPYGNTVFFSAKYLGY